MIEAPPDHSPSSLLPSSAGHEQPPVWTPSGQGGNTHGRATALAQTLVNLHVTRLPRRPTHSTGYSRTDQQLANTHLGALLRDECTKNAQQAEHSFPLGLTRLAKLKLKSMLMRDLSYTVYQPRSKLRGTPVDKPHHKQIGPELVASRGKHLGTYWTDHPGTNVLPRRARRLTRFPLAFQVMTMTGTTATRTYCQQARRPTGVRSHAINEHTLSRHVRSFHTVPSTAGANSHHDSLTSTRIKKNSHWC
mgnify:CR=1 FL=1